MAGPAGHFKALSLPGVAQRGHGAQGPHHRILHTLHDLCQVKFVLPGCRGVWGRLCRCSAWSACGCAPLSLCTQCGMADGARKCQGKRAHDSEGLTFCAALTTSGWGASAQSRGRGPAGAGACGACIGCTALPRAQRGSLAAQRPASTMLVANPIHQFSIDGLLPSMHESGVDLAVEHLFALLIHVPTSVSMAREVCAYSR